MTQEQQPTSVPQEIQLGEEFFPFRNGYDVSEHLTYVEYNGVLYKGPQFIWQCIDLRLPGFKKPVQIELMLHAWEADGVEIVPFNPSAGYRITSEDFDLEKRKLKFKESLHMEKINPKAPYALLIDCISYGGHEFYDLNRGDTVAVGDETFLIDDLGEIMQNLRVQVTANGTYESIPFWEEGWCWWGFFPADAPKLAYSEDSYDSLSPSVNCPEKPTRVHHLNFSANREQWAQIGVRIYLTPEGLNDTHEKS